MMVKNISEIEEIARQIRRYLLDHPNAADSAEGVAQWWLASQQIQFPTEKVKMALDYLVKNDFISKSSTSGGKAVYANKKTSRTH